SRFRANRCDEQPLIATTKKTAVNVRKRHIGGLRPRIECILLKKYSSRFPAGENAARKNSDISLPDDSLIRHHRYTRPRVAGTPSKCHRPPCSPSRKYFSTFPPRAIA